MLGSRARERLSTFLADRRKAADVPDWSTYLHGVWVAENSCLQDIIKIAQQELRVEEQSSLRKRLREWARPREKRVG